MKLSTVQNNVQTGLTGQEFTINSSAIAFELLVKDLYKDTPLSVVREIVLNAVDATRKNGGKVSITVPSLENPMLVVQDTGIGMDEEFIYKVYTSFFSSTKNDSNDETGSFGLGAKTPLAYTDTFMIQSAKDGVENTFAIFKNDKGIPCIQKLDTKVSDKTGTSVSVNIHKDDIYDFQGAIVKVVSGLDVIPELTNADDKFKLKVESSFDYAHSLFLRDSFNEKHSVSMGNIIYEFYIDRFISSYDRAEINRFLNTKNYRFNLVANIGDLDISPSREELRDTDKNKKTIKKLFQEAVYKTFIDDFEKVSVDMYRRDINEHLTEAKNFFELNYKDYFEKTQAIADKYNEYDKVFNSLKEGVFPIAVVVSGKSLIDTDITQFVGFNSSRRIGLWTVEDKNLKKVQIGASGWVPFIRFPICDVSSESYAIVVPTSKVEAAKKCFLNVVQYSVEEVRKTLPKCNPSLRTKKQAAEKQVEVRITNLKDIASDIRCRRPTVKISSSEASEYLILNEPIDDIFGDKYNFWSRISRLYSDVPAFREKVGNISIVYAKSTSALNNLKKVFTNSEDAFKHVLNVYNDINIYNEAMKTSEKPLINDYMLETIKNGIPALYNSEGFQKLLQVKTSNIGVYYSIKDKVNYNIDFIEEDKEPEYDKEFFDYAKSLYYMYDRYYADEYKNILADLIALKFAS